MSITSFKLADWMAANPGIDTVKPVVCDLNGVLRGKRMPPGETGKLEAGGLKLPLTTLFVDIWGRDVIGSGQVFETGDADGLLHLTERGLLALPWTEPASALALMAMTNEDGSPHGADPRAALDAVVARYEAKGLTPVVATELEFYLFSEIAPDGSPELPAGGGGLYSLSDLDRFEPFLNDVYAACDFASIPADCAISESGPGQMEININHMADPMKAADDALFFKHIVKSVARKHGLTASFMAKPFGEEAGNGLHMHFSLLDTAGTNIFASGTPEGADALRWAIGGLCDALVPSTLIFAPHANSYRRLRVGTHAPVNVSWGYDNRTAAIRVPSGPDAARRIEHRVAGADANPYLAMASILGAALDGIEGQTDPGPAIEGDASTADRAAKLLATWHGAIEAFDASGQMRALFGDFLVDMFTACKRQEYEAFAADISPAEYGAYLNSL